MSGWFSVNPQKITFVDSQTILVSDNFEQVYTINCPFLVGKTGKTIRKFITEHPDISFSFCGNQETILVKSQNVLVFKEEISNNKSNLSFVYFGKKNPLEAVLKIFETIDFKIKKNGTDSFFTLLIPIVDQYNLAILINPFQIVNKDKNKIGAANFIFINKFRSIFKIDLPLEEVLEKDLLKFIFTLKEKISLYSNKNSITSGFIKNIFTSFEAN